MSPLARLCPDCGDPMIRRDLHHCPAGDAKRAAANQRKNTRPEARGVYNTARWRRLRARILARDDHTCDNCGAAATSVHHIEPFSGPDDPLAWYPANLVTLCLTCHGRIDGQRSYARRVTG